MTSDRPSLFLLEHSYEQAAEADLARMHRALTLAVIRLVDGGTPLRIVAGVFVPDQARCFYVLEAAVADQVVEATDVAGLANCQVRPVVRLDDMPTEAGTDNHNPIEG
jgi:hypothetical protein